jgi:LmbE family N-acetylglucosaminyl deacetylase
MGVQVVLVDPAEVFRGAVLVTVPHMDDGVLACGGTIAKLPQKERIHIVYATDGMRSPAPVVPWRDSISPDLGVVRMEEAQIALGCLGVPRENIHFLGLPDCQLRRDMRALSRSLEELIGRIEPTHILMPFRYDRHADHLALNHAITDGHERGRYKAYLTEYFVYYRWRLLTLGDVRKYIRPQHLLEVNIQDVSAQKRAALDCFKSQTTEFYTWQTRPILTSSLLEEVSQTPEFFLPYDASVPGAAVFSRAVTWIRLAHRLEPLLKKRKDQVVAFWARGFHRNDRQGP